MRIKDSKRLHQGLGGYKSFNRIRKHKFRKGYDLHYAVRVLIPIAPLADSFRGARGLACWLAARLAPVALRSLLGRVRLVPLCTIGFEYS